MLLLLLACGGRPSETTPERQDPRDLVDLVDPAIGTGGQGYSVGCAFPGPARPFGLVKPSPDTADESGISPGYYHGGGYHADDELVQGFSHLHAHGIGVTAYGVVALMPADGMDATKTAEEGYRLRMAEGSERASAGLYEVGLLDPAGEPLVEVALTATDRTALHRYTFAEGSTPTVILDLEHGLDGGEALGASLSMDPETGRFEGWMDSRGQMGPAFRTWFAGILDPAPTGWGSWGDGEPVEGQAAASGVDAGGYWTFDPAALEGGVVSVRLALSLVDAEGAAANLEAEHDGFDLEAGVAAARAAWEEAFAGVRVTGGEDEEAVIFATALYHALLMPTAIDDVDGRYRGFDDEIHVAEGHRYHTDFSLWDTYRTAHPLYTLLWPEAHTGMLRSLARMAEQGGALPLWPLATYDASVMLGSPASVVVGEAWQKALLRAEDGGPDPDASVLLNAALDAAFDRVDLPYGARPDVALYDAHGYYPADQVDRSVAWTQEVSIADGALAPMAAALGEEEAAALLEARARYYRNVYDPEVGYFHARDSDGLFAEDFDDRSWGDEYTEGNARQYLWLATHDPEGLIETLGGEAAAVERLSAFFEASAREEQTFWPRENYWHGNEPDLHAPWLFAVAGRPDLTREWVDWVARTFYGTGPDGLAGNDDAGTLSAWFVFTAMGLYPMAGTDRYVLGQPRFSSVEFEVEGGTFLITADEGEGVSLNGLPWAPPTLPHRAITAGGRLAFGGWP